MMVMFFGLFCFPTIFYHLQNYTSSLFINLTENAAYIKQNLSYMYYTPFHQSYGKDSPAITKGMSSSFHRKLILLCKYLFVCVGRSRLY